MCASLDHSPVESECMVCMSFSHSPHFSLSVCAVRLFCWAIKCQARLVDLGEETRGLHLEEKTTEREERSCNKQRKRKGERKERLVYGVYRDTSVLLDCSVCQVSWQVMNFKMICYW